MRQIEPFKDLASDMPPQLVGHSFGLLVLGGLLQISGMSLNDTRRIFEKSNKSDHTGNFRDPIKLAVIEAAFWTLS